MKTLTAAALILALAGTTSALASPALKGDIVVNAGVVTVGDMFENAGALSETAIFRSPAPGTSGIVPLAAVRHAADLVGLTDFENVGFTRVRVARASTTITEPVLDGLISADLARRGILANGMTAQVRFDLTGLSYDVAAVDEPVRLVNLRYMPGNGAFTARFQMAGIDTPIELGGSIRLMIEAPRLIATHKAGDRLAAGDFEMVPVPAGTADAGGFAELDQLIGKQLLRQSHAGRMLKPTDVSEPTVVARNAPVTVILKAGAMTLTVKGQALGAAAAGQPVDVLNTATRKVLHGIARPDGAVEIVTAVTIASR